MSEQANPSSDKAVQTGHIQTGCQNPLAKTTAEISPNALKLARHSLLPLRHGSPEAVGPAAALRLWLRRLRGTGTAVPGLPCCPPHRSPPAQGPACLQLPSAALPQLFPLLFCSDFSARRVPCLTLSPFSLCHLLLSCFPAVPWAPGTFQPWAAHCVLAAATALADHTQRSFRAPHIPCITLLLCTLLILYALQVLYGNWDQKESAFCQREMLDNKRNE